MCARLLVCKRRVFKEVLVPKVIRLFRRKLLKAEWSRWWRFFSLTTCISAFPVPFSVSLSNSRLVPFQLEISLHVFSFVLCMVFTTMALHAQAPTSAGNQLFRLGKIHSYITILSSFKCSLDILMLLCVLEVRETSPVSSDCSCWDRLAPSGGISSFRRRGEMWGLYAE